MSTRRSVWRRLAPLLVGMVVGAIGLVMWSSSSASALDTPPAATPPGLSSGIDQLAGQVTAPVEQLLEPLGVDISPAVDPLTEQAIVPVTGMTETTVEELARRLTPLPIPPATTVPGLPSLPGTGAVVDELAGPAELGSPAPAGDPDPSPVVTISHHRSVPRLTDAIGTLHPRTEPASVVGGPSPDPVPPTPARPMEAGVGTLSLNTGSASTGLVLLAVLAGLAVVAARPLSRRLVLAGPLSPRALAHAIATPPG